MILKNVPKSDPMFQKIWRMTYSVLSYSLDAFIKMCLHMRTHCIDLK